MIDSGLEGAKIVQLARLTYEGQRLYPGLDGAYWHGVLDKGAKLGGVFLATKPPRGSSGGGTSRSGTCRRQAEFLTLP